MMKNQSSHWWWFDSHSSSRRSTWLQSTLAELDANTTAMLKLIEEDADSFAQRAEMYYKKRPELISLVEEFYRAHRSLAERYDQLKSDSGTRLLTTLGSPFSATKSGPEKLTNVMEQMDENCSETCDPEEAELSEVDDPDQEDEETHNNREVKEDEVPRIASNEEMRQLREEIERLKEENSNQKDQLVQKDEEKREVIRQLSLAVDMLKDENVNLRKCLARDSSDPKKRIRFDFNKFKGEFLGKLFSGGSSKVVSVVAL